MEIEGKTVKVDPSSVGHAWRIATEDDVPAHIQAEIAWAILDDGQDRTSCFIASNSVHYRWA